MLSCAKSRAHRVEGGIVVEHDMWAFNSGAYQVQQDLLCVPILGDAAFVTGQAVVADGGL